jgi:branched-chain amino acid transport system substrate-binding protein
MRLSHRALTGPACVVLAALLAACGTTTAATTTIAGKTLSVYASVPMQGPESSTGNDVLDAERLALQQAGDKVGSYTVVLKALNDATSTGSSPKLVADNSRTVIQQKNAVAYLGEIDPNASADSIPITNADQLLQVTPYDTAIGLTQATPAVSNSPDTYYESLSANGRTFGRVVPSDVEQAKAQLQLMKSLGVHKLYIAEDGTAYGGAIAVAVDQDATANGITGLLPQRAGAGLSQKIAASGADSLFYGGVANAAAAQQLDGAIAADPHLKLFGPGGLYSSSFVAQLSPAAQRALYLSEPGLTSKELPPAGRDFVTAFEAAYHHPPSTQAIFGYAAMEAVLGALHRSSAPNNRADDVAAFFATKNDSSALGTYSIDKSGDTSLAPYLFGRVRAGKLVVFKSLIVP